MFVVFFLLLVAFLLCYYLFPQPYTCISVLFLSYPFPPGPPGGYTLPDGRCARACGGFLVRQTLLKNYLPFRFARSIRLSLVKQNTTNAPHPYTHIHMLTKLWTHTHSHCSNAWRFGLISRLPLLLFSSPSLTSHYAALALFPLCCCCCCCCCAIFDTFSFQFIELRWAKSPRDNGVTDGGEVPVWYDVYWRMQKKKKKKINNMRFQCYPWSIVIGPCIRKIVFLTTAFYCKPNHLWISDMVSRESKVIFDEFYAYNR